VATIQHQLELDSEAASAGALESFTLESGVLTRRFDVGGEVISSAISVGSAYADDLRGLWWKQYLEGERPVANRSRGTVRTIDLFCGPGGLALGLGQFASEFGMSVVSEGIVDEDSEATKVYASNHNTRAISNESVSSVIDYRVRGTAGAASFTYEPEIIDDSLAAAAVRSDVVLAGPPCQGHSNLNNHSRRVDPRNELYLTVPAFAIAGDIPIAIIENVPAVLNDSSHVVDSARHLFETAGYEVTMGLLRADDMGWPQTRKRHFMIARKDAQPLPLSEVADILRDGTRRSVWWAIGDLEELSATDALHRSTNLSVENEARIAWLFDNDEHDLASSERPESHKNGTTYTAVYGRLHRDEPAPTITTGFMSPGRGRYTHPTQRRVLTAREAARIQGFPDTYDFAPDPANPPTKLKLAKWIGDAVPMPLGYAAAMSALAPGLPD